MQTLPPETEMRRAHQERDASFDGLFFVAVKTTGIFCRPSCPARTPLPGNVEYFPTVSRALFAGYRPCRRCHPMQVNGELPDWASSLVAEIEADPSTPLSDGELRRRGLEPARVRRTFQRRFGLTFHAFRRAHRLGRALEAIRTGSDATGAGFEVGFESSSGFRDAFARFFGRPPGDGRDAAAITIGWVPSPLGPLVAGATDAGVCLLEFTDRRALEAQLQILKRRFGLPLIPGRHLHLDALTAQLREYFAGRHRQFTVPLLCPGTPFQQRVWQELQAIPFGETRSYEQLAIALGSPNAQRAVGHANGLNRIAILIPCHRVITKAGTLGGYGGGLWRKHALLELEQATGPEANGSAAAASVTRVGEGELP